ncbi:MAG: GNAT family N-acetyltransferase [Deinococcales bacterium]
MSVEPYHFSILQSQTRHAKAISDIIKLAHGASVSDTYASCPEVESVCKQIATFPEGHLVAVTEIAGQEVVMGVAIAMRTQRSPHKTSLAWMDMIGDITLVNHNPKGKWLYGVEMSVRPEFQGHGVGSALYKARFKLVQRLGLRGIYMGGMLKGYHNYADSLSVEAYAAKVKAGELRDPTVTTQMNRGFEAKDIILKYDEGDDQAGGTAMLLIWDTLKHHQRPSPQHRTKYQGHKVTQRPL